MGAYSSQKRTYPSLLVCVFVCVCFFFFLLLTFSRCATNFKIKKEHTLPCLCVFLCVCVFFFCFLLLTFSRCATNYFFIKSFIVFFFNFHAKIKTIVACVFMCLYRDFGDHVMIHRQQHHEEKIQISGKSQFFFLFFFFFEITLQNHAIIFGENYSDMYFSFASVSPSLNIYPTILFFYICLENLIIAPFGTG